MITLTDLFCGAGGSSTAAINVGELAEHIGAEHAHIVRTHLLGSNQKGHR